MLSHECFLFLLIFVYKTRGSLRSPCQLPWAAVPHPTSLPFLVVARPPACWVVFQSLPQEEEERCCLGLGVVSQVHLCCQGPELGLSGCLSSPCPTPPLPGGMQDNPAAPRFSWGKVREAGAARDLEDLPGGAGAVVKASRGEGSVSQVQPVAAPFCHTRVGFPCPLRTPW